MADKFILFATMLQVLSISLFTTYDLAIIYNMPVITRSQSRVSLINSTKQPILSPDSLNSSLLESSMSTQLLDTSAHSSTLPLDTALLIDSLPSTNLPCSRVNSSLSLYSTSSLEFETLELPTNNFTISKSIECNTTESRSFENLVFLKFQSSVHNFQSSRPTMAEDCEEDLPMMNTSSGLQDITQLLASLSTQISAQNAKLTNEIYQVIQTTTSFKQEVRSELNELRALVWDLKNLVPDTAPSSSVTWQHAPSSVQHVTQGSSLPPPVSPSPTLVIDQQTEMMMLFAQSMSKLSSVLSEKSEPKSEWPKFANDQKK
jgi:hypothetical protein